MWELERGKQQKLLTREQSVPCSGGGNIASSNSSFPLFFLYFHKTICHNWVSFLYSWKMCLYNILYSVLLCKKKKKAWRTAPSEKPVFTLRWFPPAALVCLSTTRGSLTYIGSYISRAKGARLDSCWRRAKSAVGAELWAGCLDITATLPPPFFLFLLPEACSKWK